MRIVLLCLIGFVSAAHAQSTPRCGAEAGNSDCQVTTADVDRFCNFVSAKTRSREQGRFTFSAEQWLWQMSGARVGLDSDSLAKMKIQRLWRANRAAFECHTTRMDGDILSIAVRSNFPELLEFLYYDYDLDLNYVDRLRNGTVLDYVSSEIARLEQSGLRDSDAVKSLRGYYNTFRNDLGVSTPPSFVSSAIH